MRQGRVVGLLGVCLMFSCGPGPGPGADADLRDAETWEIVDNLLEAGFPESEIAISAEDEVYVGNDVLVTLTASQEMLRPDLSVATHEQYRSSNLVGYTVRTICVDGSRLTGTLSTGLDMAIQNFNQVGLYFDMVRSQGGQSGCDAVIAALTMDGAVGLAGFPSRGLPCSEIKIGTGMAPLGLDLTEHVTTHELGHCVGFRHSDYFDSSISCGGEPRSPTGGAFGFNLIPGTPSGASPGGSLMNSCYRPSETGEFSSSDVTALQTLYAPKRAQGSTMQSAEGLMADEFLTSSNGEYVFAYQSDGNLVLYKNQTPIWASNTGGQPAGLAVLQSDGNLVVYGERDRVAWASNTGGSFGSTLHVQDDGNVVIYGANGGGPVWATNTAM